MSTTVMTATQDSNNDIEAISRRIKSDIKALEELMADKRRLESLQIALQETSARDHRGRIVALVAQNYNLSVAEMVGPRRPDRIVFPRQVAMALLYECTNMTLGEIGDLFGGRNHGTVLHAIRVVNDRCATDRQTNEELNHLRILLPSLQK